MLEPIETLYVETPADKLGDILQNLANRKGEIVNMNHHTSTVSVEAIIPTRGLIGFETDLVNLTRGEGLMSHLFKEYGPKRGEITTRQNGVLVSMESGDATAFAINNIQERGKLFISPGDAVYAGMVVGENSRPDDMTVNPCKAKQLTNMRSQGDGKGVQLDTPIKMSLERALEYIGPDEFVEATPSALRLRKKILDENRRRRAEKTSRSVPRSLRAGPLPCAVKTSLLLFAGGRRSPDSGMSTTKKSPGPRVAQPFLGHRQPADDGPQPPRGHHRRRAARGRTAARRRNPLQPHVPQSPGAPRPGGKGGKRRDQLLVRFRDPDAEADPRAEWCGAGHHRLHGRAGATITAGKSALASTATRPTAAVTATPTRGWNRRPAINRGIPPGTRFPSSMA